MKKARENIIKNRTTVACYKSWTFSQLIRTEKCAAFMGRLCKMVFVFVIV